MAKTLLSLSLSFNPSFCGGETCLELTEVSQSKNHAPVPNSDARSVGSLPPSASDHARQHFINHVWISARVPWSEHTLCNPHHQKKKEDALPDGRNGGRRIGGRKNSSSMCMQQARLCSEGEISLSLAFSLPLGYLSLSYSPKSL